MPNGWHPLSQRPAMKQGGTYATQERFPFFVVVAYVIISPENKAKVGLEIFLGCELNGSMRDQIEVTQQLNK